MTRITVRGMLARRLRLALTALAIVLGVTFVTGTLVLTDTLNRTFDTLIGTAYQHINFQVRGTAAFNNDTAAAANGSGGRKPIPASIAAAIRRLPGVAYVDPSVAGYAQFVSGGSAIGGPGSALGFSFDPNPKLSSVRLVQGSAPSAADELVMDRGTATKYHFRVGDRVRVLSDGQPQRFTITGIVTFGAADNLAGATLAGFDLPTAQALFNTRGDYDTINILAKPGADNVRLERAIAKVLPAGVQVVSGQTVAGELSSAVSNALSFLSTALLVFALISLFVGAFTIFNTFSITVGQRTRELALLRMVGASRRQVFRSVLGEAVLVGLAASLIGLGLGVLAAVALKALLGAFGVTLPSAPLVFEARTVVLALAVGVGVTVISAIGPARRAVRIAPVAALVATREEPAESLRRRVTIGGLAATGGIAALVAGLTAPAILLVGVGAVAVFIAAGLLAPIVARPMAGLLGRPLGALLGAPGRLGRENSMRSPRRTAQTAAALMVGIALVSAMAGLGASLSQSARTNLESAVTAEDIITGPSSGFSTSVAAAVARLPGVSTVTSVYKGQFELRGSLSSLDAVTPAGLRRTVHLAITAGRGAPALAAGELLIDTATASAKHLSVGSVAPVTFAQTGPATIRVGGIFKANPLIGSYVVGAGFFLSHFHDPLPVAVLIGTQRGAGHVERAINNYLGVYPNVAVQSRAQFEQSQQATVNQELGLVYVLLALAIVVALIGIVNTLMLSVFERTHELGLLRAVGMKRRQVRAMIRSEAVIIALFGAVVGEVIGTALGVAFAASLKQQGITEIAIPYASLGGFLVLAALLGLAAASWPARRAAKLDGARRDRGPVNRFPTRPSGHPSLGLLRDRPPARNMWPGPDDLVTPETSAMKAKLSLLAAAGLLAGTGALWLAAHQPAGRPTEPGPVLTLLVGASLLGCGLASWRARPDNRVGKIMVLTGFAWFAAQLIEATPPWLNTIGLAVQSAWIIGLVWLLLSFPSGRLPGRLDRWLVAATAALALGVQLVAMLYGNKAGLHCPGCANNLLQVVHENHKALAWRGLQFLMGAALIATVIALLLRRWLRASAAQRRAVAPVLVAGCATLAALTWTIVEALLGSPFGALPANVYLTLMATVPVAVLFVLLQRRLARGMVAGLVVELGGPSASVDLRDALARALGDPTLQLAFWFPPEKHYVDGDGTPVKLPHDGSGRSSTFVARDGQPIAVLLHDPVLEHNAELVESVCAAASLTLENERLQAELRARLHELQASRARLVQATDAERRRIERDLHDGTQQRLVSIAMSLGLLETKLPGQAEAAQPLVRETREALALALAELREFTHGINPPLLTERGLPAALDELCRRAAIPTRLDATIDQRLPDQIETAAYFMVSEALTNAAKHSHSTEIRVFASYRGQRLTIEIGDDGIGGATPTGGSGLRGLADRIEALGGRLTISSPPGRGTTLRAEIPCA